MRLEYNILWIDNDLQGYIDNGSVKSVEEYLMEKGFEPTIEKVFDEANLDKVIFNHNYDLIISDYNLENTTGDVIIEKIRNEKRLDTEILFYTSQIANSYKTEESVRNRLAFIERLSFQIGRDRLLDKIERVIGLTLGKLLELNATRGLITAATSDLDIEIEEVVMHLVLKQKVSDDKLREIVADKVHGVLQRKLDNFWDNYIDFKSYFHKIDAVKKWEIFRDLLKPLKFNPDIKTFLDNNKSYQNQVIEVRNQFAHAKAINIEGQLILKARVEGRDFEFNEENCILIRQNLIRHKKELLHLKKLISDD